MQHKPLRGPNEYAGDDGTNDQAANVDGAANKRDTGGKANAEADAVYRQLSALPDGPERKKHFDEAKRLAVAYMPYKPKVHRIHTDLAHPWVIGYRRPLFWQDWWHLVDIDLEQKGKR